MGQALPRQAQAPQQQAYIDRPERHLIEDMRSTIVVKRIGNGRFMKSFHCKEQRELGSRSVVVKVYVKQEVDEDLEIWRQGTENIGNILRNRRICPNVQPYSRVFAGKRPVGRGVTGAAYCVRQHFWSNLYDRIGTRPFLSTVERKWIAYQLLRAVEQCHSLGVCHGDLNAENVMVSSWSWITLVDFASYKPVSLADDGPEFDYYFCAGQRHNRCYVAPERFQVHHHTHQDQKDSLTKSKHESTSSSSSASHQEAKTTTKHEEAEEEHIRKEYKVLTPAMDVFSLGCVLAELYRGGTPTLDVATVVKSLQEERSCIDAGVVFEDHDDCPQEPFKAAIRLMLQRDPSQRGNAASHRHELTKAGVLPHEFDSLLFDLFVQVLLDARTPDERVALVARHYGRAMEETAGIHDDEGAAFFDRAISETAQVGLETSALLLNRSADQIKEEHLGDMTTAELVEHTEYLLRLYNEAAARQADPSSAHQANPSVAVETKALKKTSLKITDRAEPRSLVLLAQLVCVTVRHAKWPRTKLIAMALLSKFARYLDDEARLQRLVPHFVALLEDSVAAVRAKAVRSLAECVALVDTFGASDANLFPKYLFPALNPLLADPEEGVIVAVAENIATLANAAAKFDTRSNSSSSTMRITQVRRWVVILLSEAPAAAKVAVLRELPRLCIFFGREQTQDVLMPHLITLLNDSDWALRYAFCAHAAGIGAFLGQEASEGLVSPCVGQALVDTEPLVISRALRALTVLVQLGLLGEYSTLEIVYVAPASARPLLVHPSSTVRSSAAELVAAACRALCGQDPADALARVLDPALDGLLAKPLASRRLDDLFDADAAFVSAANSSSSNQEEEALHTSPLALAILAALRPPVSTQIYRSALRRQISAKENASLAPMADYLGVASGHFLNHRTQLQGRDLIEEYSMTSSRRRRRGHRMEEDEDDTDDNNNTGDHAYDAELEEEHLLIPRAATVRRRQSSEASAASNNTDEDDEEESVSPTESKTRPIGGLVPRPRLTHVQTLLVPDQKFVSLLEAAKRQRGIKRWSKAVDEEVYEDDEAMHEAFSVLDGDSNLARSAVAWDADDFFASNSISGDGKHSDSKASNKASGNRRLSRPPKLAVAVPADDEDSTMAAAESSTTAPSTPVTLRGGQGHDDNKEKINQAPYVRSGMTALGRRVVGLSVPALPPELGCLKQPTDGQPFSWYATALALDEKEAARRLDWRPKAGVVVAAFYEHRGAVARLAVAQDQSFFASASHDGTARVWVTRGLDRSVTHRSVAAYTGQSGGALTDACAVDNSRSVATASSNGTVHVWRVELAPGVQSSPMPGEDVSSNNYNQRDPFLGEPRSYSLRDRNNKSDTLARQSRLALVREIAPPSSEGAVVSVNHYNTDHQCLVVYATQRGMLRACDLRLAPKEKESAWTLEAPAELGLLTAVALGNDRNWCCAGTSRGFVALWDVRYGGSFVKLWRHSTKACIHRLATCARLPLSSADAPPAPLAFVAAGANQVAVWDLANGGPCHQCFRAVRTSMNDYNGNSNELVDPATAAENWALPTLEPVSIAAHPQRRAASLCAKTGYLDDLTRLPALSQLAGEDTPTVRAIMGRISAHGNSYLLTGGTDCHVRYWDFLSPSRCFTVSGPQPGAPRPTYEIPRVSGENAADTRLVVCRDADPPDPPAPSDLPLLNVKGPLAPPTAHRDAILDLKAIDYPLRIMLTCSRDGVIKAWR